MKPFYLFSIIIISCLGIIVYSNTFLVQFQLDDNTSIVDNFAIRNIHNLQSIWGFLPRRFILYLSLALNYHFIGLNVFGYHLFNLMVHLATAVLVWWLTLLTLSSPVMKGDKIARYADIIALFAGLIFVSHPVQTEAVTYIVQRAASMATMFYLASLCCYIQSRMLQGKVRHFYYFVSLILAMAAMFTKETSITLPLMILLYEFTFLKVNKNTDWRRLAPFLSTLFIIPVTMLLTETGAARLHQLRSEPGISSLHYLLTQFRVIVTYIRLVFLPVHQNLDYDYPVFKNILDWPVMASLIFLISILFLAKRLFLKYRMISFSIFWFFLTLLPESSIFPIQDVIFEHRLYLPMVGYSMFLVSSVYYVTGLYCHSEPEGRRIIRHLKILRFARDDKALRMTMAILTLIIACYSVLTYQRNIVWGNSFALWNDTVRKSPHKARPYNNRGLVYYHKDDLSQAMSDFNKSIELDPDYKNAYFNRGILYAYLGNFSKAISDFVQAIKIDPNYEKAYYCRGLIYAKEGKLVQAIAVYSKAIEINPNYLNSYYDRGLCFARQGNFIQALSDYNEDIEMNPKDGQAYNNRAIIYYQLKEYDKALDDTHKAQEFGIDNPQLISALIKVTHI